MPNRKTTDQQISLEILYQVASAHWAHAEQIRWTTMYNILTANSVFVLAWAALIATGTRSLIVIFGSLLICFSGVILNIVWICLELRANGFVYIYANIAREMENHSLLDKSELSIGAFTSAQAFRGSIKGISSWFPTRVVVVLVPSVFAILFLIQGIISLILVQSVL